MSASSETALDLPAASVLRWAFKAFLTGWLLGVAAGIIALVKH